MKIIETKDYQDLSNKAAQFIIEKVHNNPEIVLGLATGGTPKGTYEVIIQDHKQQGTTYKQVKSVNLDEYVGLSNAHPNSYHSYMNENLFKYIDIPSAQTYLPNGSAQDLEAECLRYDQLIASFGGVDLQLLGIGQNGHIGFNEPGTPFNTKTHIVELTRSTRKANARYFENINDVPTQAITMGIQSILDSKEILLLASGKNKAEAIDKLINEQLIDEAFPASALHKHPQVTLIADREALSIVYKREKRA